MLHQRPFALAGFVAIAQFDANVGLASVSINSRLLPPPSEKRPHVRRRRNSLERLFHPRRFPHRPRPRCRPFRAWREDHDFAPA